MMKFGSLQNMLSLPGLFPKKTGMHNTPDTDMPPDSVWAIYTEQKNRQRACKRAISTARIRISDANKAYESVLERLYTITAAEESSLNLQPDTYDLIAKKIKQCLNDYNIVGTPCEQIPGNTAMLRNAALMLEAIHKTHIKIKQAASACEINVLSDDIEWHRSLMLENYNHTIQQQLPLGC